MNGSPLRSRSRWSIIFASFSVALMLDMAPLPASLDWLWPQWLLMTLIFWCIEAPSKVGLFTAWCSGLVSDLSGGALLGVQAVASVSIAYIVLLSYRRVRQYPVIQQTGFVFMLVLAHQLMVLAIQHVASDITITLRHIATVFTSAFLWPWIQYILFRIRTQNE